MATIRDRYILEMSTDTSGLRGLNQQLGSASGGGGRGLLGGLARIGPLAAAAGGALAGVAGASLISNVTASTAAYQDMMTTLETVTGGAEQASQAMQFINDFATSTPFAIDELTGTFIALQNAGIEPTRDLLTTLGDAASVSSDKVGSLQALTNLFSRSVQGGIGVEELDTLAQRGINVYGILQEQLGITRGDVSELGATAEGAAQLTNALLEGFDREYGGGMERASDNLSTSLSNMGIAANNALIAVGQGGLADGVQYAAEAVTTLFNENSALATALGETLGNAITVAVDAISGIISSFQEGEGAFGAIKEAVASIIPLWEALYGLFEALQPILGPIINLIGTVLAGAFRTVVEILTSVVNLITSFVDSLSFLAEPIEAVATAVGNAFTFMRDTVVGIVTGIVDFVADKFQWLADVLWNNSIISDMIDNIIEGFGGMGENILSFFLDMPARIAGAFVDIATAVVNSIVNLVSNVGETLRNAFREVGEFFSNLFGGDDEDIAETTANLESALDTNLDPTNLDNSATALRAVEEIISGMHQDLVDHNEIIQRVNENLSAYDETLDDFNNTLDDYNDLRETAQEYQSAEQEYYEATNELLASYNDLMSEQLEHLSSKNESLETLNGLYETNSENLDVLTEAYENNTSVLDALVTGTDEVRESVEDFSETLDDAANDYISTYVDALNEIIETSENTRSQTEQLIVSFNNMASAAQAAQTAARSALTSINEALSASTQLSEVQTSRNASGTGNNTSILDFFAGGFAKGGYIPAGQFGLVGEAGPELVNGPARVTPMGMGSAGNTNITYNINALDTSSFKSMLARDPGFVHSVVSRGAASMPRRR